MTKSAGKPRLCTLYSIYRPKLHSSQVVWEPHLPLQKCLMHTTPHTSTPHLPPPLLRDQICKIYFIIKLKDIWKVSPGCCSRKTRWAEHDFVGELLSPNRIPGFFCLSILTQISSHQLRWFSFIFPLRYMIVTYVYKVYCRKAIRRGPGRRSC